MDGIPVKINRGGFSGEKLGYELYISPEHTKKAVEKLREAAPKFDAKQITDIQVMVWTLPSERGYYLMSDIGWATPSRSTWPRASAGTRSSSGKKHF